MSTSNALGSNAPAAPAAPAAPSATPPGDAAPAAPAAPSAKFTFPENWRDSLPEDMRGEPALQTIHDLEGLTKSYLHAQKMIGKDRLVIPDSKLATEEDWKNAFEKLGLPKELKDYEIKLGKESKINPDFLTHFKEQAHKAGVLPRQAQKLMEWYEQASVDAGKRLSEEARAKQDEGLKALEKEWGKAYGKHVEAAKLMIKDFGDDEVRKLFDETPIGNEPAVLRFLAKIGMTLREEELSKGETGEATMTPEQAKSEYGRILGNPEHPYNKKDHPNHAAAVQEVRKIFQQAYPEPA